MRSAGLTPRIREIEASWQPTLEYFDRHLTVLRTLEESGLLRAFRVESKLTGALLDSNSELEFWPAGMRLTAGASLEDKSAHMAMGITLDTLTPGQLNSLRIRMQYVIPSTFRDAKEAQAEAARRLLGRFINESEGLDFAVLLDGKFAQMPGAYQVEFGVVGAEEVTNRLRGVVGRMGTRSATVTGDEQLEPSQASFFADWRWSLNSQVVDGDIFGQIVQYEKDLLEETARASTQLATGLLTSQTPPIEGAVS